MSHFYASIPTSARNTIPTARGHKSTGISSLVASANGSAIRVTMWTDEDGTDRFSVVREPHAYGSGPKGGKEILAEGTI